MCLSFIQSSWNKIIFADALTGQNSFVGEGQHFNTVPPPSRKTQKAEAKA